MPKTKIYLNKLQIISEILATIMIIIIPIINNYKFVTVGWILVLLTCMGDGIFIKKWGMSGRTWNYKKDENYKEQLTGKYSDTIFFIISILVLLMCPIALFNSFFEENYFALICAYLLSTIILILIQIFTDKETKKVAKIIPNIRK